MRWIVLLIAFITTATASAQTVAFNVVVRDTDGRVLADVEVSVPLAGQRAITDSAGRARLTGIVRGSYTVRARRLGFEPVSVRAPIDDDSPELVIVLKARVALLDTIRVVENCPWRGFGGFECRQRVGKGLFLDYAAIDSSRVDDVAKLFYDRPGYRVGFDRKGFPHVMATTGWMCLVVIVDGLPVSLTNPMPRYTDELLGVEAYATGETVPNDYEKYSWKGKYRCGLINYWTVRGNR